jgi:peptidoglycan/LPS O-acetylase OafA/YrhL
LALTLVFAIAPLRTFAMTSPEKYWAVGMVCACALLLSAAAGYAIVERPGITLGKRCIRLRRTMADSPQHVADGDRAARAHSQGSAIAP